MGNTVLALSASGAANAPLPLARTVAVTDTTPAPTVSELKLRLEEELGKMLAAGHLKPGLFKSWIGDDTLIGNGTAKAAMDRGIFYFSTPGDTIYALIRAMPHLSFILQSQVREYISLEMASYPLDTYAHIGFLDGAPRQAAVVPPDYESKFAVGKQTGVVNNQPWKFPMMAFYAAWKYSQLWPDEALKLYDNLRPKLTVPPILTDSQLLIDLQALNAYIAGYRGYLELEQLAGRTESSAVRAEHDRLVSLRVSDSAMDPPPHVQYKLRYFGMARHFLNLVPELGQELARVRLPEVRNTLERIDAVTPYWFVGGNDVTHREGSHQQLYDVAILNAHAMILKSSYAYMIKYLDAPVFAVGDLLYIHNLVSVIEAATQSGPTTAPLAPTGLRIVR